MAQPSPYLADRIRPNSFGDAAAAARDSAVAQIPTSGYPKAPAADGSQNNPLNTDLGRNVTNTLGALPGAGAVPGVAAAAGGLAARALGAATPAATAVGRVAQTAAPYAPVAGGAAALHSAAGASSPTAPAAPPATSLAGQPAAGGVRALPGSLAASPAPAPGASAPATPDNQVMPGVFNHGRGQYSDQAGGMGMPSSFTGQPNAQNMAAGESLAARSRQASMAQQSTGFQPQGVTAPTVLNSSNSWQARNDLRNLEVAASSIAHQSGRVTNDRGRVINPGVGDNGAREAYLAAVKNDLAMRGAQPGLDAVAMRENASLQREGMQQTGETARTGMREQGANAREQGRNILARDEFNLRKEASGFQTRAAQQQEQLRNVLLDPKSTPEQRAVAQRNLSALSGKTAADRMQTVTLPDTTNEMGQVVRGGQALVRVLEDGSVQQVPIGAQQGAAMPPGMTKQVGTSNGRPVYEDAKGNRFVG